jgi:endonuclease/exonuclease/phosphatase family metal-dependent hydrolase
MMYRRIGIYLIFLFLLGACGDRVMDVNVLSFNIRFANPADSADYWEYRKEQVVEVLEGAQYDFIGLQEALVDQVNYLAEHLTDYEFIWRTREIDSTQGEAVPLLYRKTNWQLIKSETFWLSDTPEIPGSNTWNAACNRVATWGIFKSMEKQQEILVCNTHFDHVSQLARINGAQLILDRMGQIAENRPIILLGDLNGKPDNPAITLLSNHWLDPYPDLYPGDTIHGTFHGFKGSPFGKRIDYIFTFGQKSVSKMDILLNNRNGAYPSDHFPVSASISF